MKKVLEENGCWDEGYHSKHLDSLIDEDFDLIVTVCDHAKEYEEFEKTFKKIKEELNI